MISGICLGKKHRIDYHGAHQEQNYCVTLADTGVGFNDRFARETGPEIRRQGALHGDLWGRSKRRDIAKLLNSMKAMASWQRLQRCVRFHDSAFGLGRERKCAGLCGEAAVEGWASAGSCF